MSSGVSIEGERESGKDVRATNGTPSVSQWGQPCLLPTLSGPRWGPRGWTRWSWMTSEKCASPTMVNMGWLRSHHPQETGSGAPHCQLACAAGATSGFRSGGWNHIGGHSGFRTNQARKRAHQDEGASDQHHRGVQDRSQGGLQIYRGQTVSQRGKPGRWGPH